MPTGVYIRTEAHKKLISKALKGHSVSNETKRKIGGKIKLRLTGRVGTETNRWRGEQAGYSAKHMWIKKMLGSPLLCWHCGKTDGTTRNYHWANLSGKYLRDYSDWARLCVSCHKLYDLGKIEVKL